MTPDPQLRDRLALALDVDDLVEARRLARELAPYFGVAKIGMELFYASGPDALAVLVEEGYRVFADLKLYDIPTTVARAEQGSDVPAGVHIISLPPPRLRPWSIF